VATTSRREPPWLYGGYRDLTSIEVSFRHQATAFGYRVINKGTNGRWTEKLMQDEVAEYEARAMEELGPEAVPWLATEAKI
jgi:hypothetical protein